MTNHHPPRPCRSAHSFEFASLLSHEMPALPSNAQNILFMVPRIPYDLILMGIIAFRLRMEGKETPFILCDNLPMCGSRDMNKNNTRNLCEHCLHKNTDFLSFNGFPYDTIWNFLGADDLAAAHQLKSLVTVDNLTQLKYKDYDLGQVQEVPIARYFLKDRPDDTAEGLRVVKEFVFSSVLLLNAFERIYRKYQPEAIVTCNGKLFWSALALAAAKKQNIRTIFYEDLSQEGCGLGDGWFFSDEGPVIDYKLIDAWKQWRDVPLTEDENKTIDHYIYSRSKGQRYFLHPKADLKEIEKELGFELKPPIVTMFTNIVWDTAVLQKHSIFGSMAEWIIESIKNTAGKPYTLLIRTHPAEKGVDGIISRQRVIDDVRKKFPSLPPNVHIIPPESSISSYTLSSHSEASIVYTSTIGMECAYNGKTTIVCGNPHYIGRGFTVDPRSKQEYFSYLNNLKSIPPITPEQRKLARRYTYLFFLRQYIPLQFFGVSGLHQVRHLRLADIKEALPGVNPYLDLVVDHISRKGNFVLPRELNYFGLLPKERLKTALDSVKRTKELLQKENRPAPTGQNPQLITLRDCFPHDGAFRQSFGPAIFAEKLELAENLRFRGKIDDAVDLLDNILMTEPNQPAALVLLGRILLNYGMTDDAEALLLRACRTEQNHSSAWFWLINCYKIKGDKKRMVETTQEWVYYNSGHIPALLQAAVILLEVGDLPQMLAILNRVEELSGHPAAEKMLAAYGY